MRHAVLLWLVPLCTWAQQQTVAQIVLSAEPAGTQFYVDGQLYSGSVTFFWPEGSKHQLDIPRDRNGFQYLHTGTTRYVFQSWTDTWADGGASRLGSPSTPGQTITASPQLRSLKATFEVYHRVEVALGGPVTDQPPDCSSPGAAGGMYSYGVVWVGGVCIPASTVLWLKAGPTPMAAYPYPGFVFVGWRGQPSVAYPFATTINIQGPMALAPLFEPGKRVRVFTDPAGMQVLVDRTPIRPEYPCPDFARISPPGPAGFPGLCPGEFDFARFTTHVFSAPSPQMGPDGKDYVFVGWSNGGGQNMPLVIEEDLNIPLSLTARFVRAVVVSVETAPRGLKLSVNGRDNWPSQFFPQAPGAKMSLVAPLEQADKSGRRYRFRSWSQGGQAAQEFVVPAGAEDTGVRLIASYDALPQAVLRAAAPVTFQVDGVACPSPCAISRSPKETARVVAPERVGAGAGSRYVFLGWSDGQTAPERILQFTEDLQLTAHYRLEHQLTATVEPADGASLQFSPSSPDGFYPDGMQVSVQAECKAGYRFRRWRGDLDHSYPQAVLTISGPRWLVATLEAAPEQEPIVVLNAAGVTPLEAVAAGSLVAIRGKRLASTSERAAGPMLPQTLGGVSVTVGDRLLPLASVSPDEIQAQLPFDLPLGEHEIVVRSASGADLRGRFHTSRNAPGLLRALRADQRPATPEQPLRAGEIMILVATGLGPVHPPAPLGFPASKPRFHTLVDAIQVRLGDRVVEALWAGASADAAGVQIIELQIPEGLKGELAVAVSVAGVPSNSLPLTFE